MPSELSDRLPGNGFRKVFDSLSDESRSRSMANDSCFERGRRISVDNFSAAWLTTVTEVADGVVHTTRPLGTGLNLDGDCIVALGHIDVIQGRIESLSAGLSLHMTLLCGFETGPSRDAIDVQQSRPGSLTSMDGWWKRGVTRQKLRTEAAGTGFNITLSILSPMMQCHVRKDVQLTQHLPRPSTAPAASVLADPATAALGRMTSFDYHRHCR